MRHQGAAPHLAMLRLQRAQRGAQHGQRDVQVRLLQGACNCFFVTAAQQWFTPCNAGSSAAAPSSPPQLPAAHATLRHCAAPAAKRSRAGQGRRPSHPSRSCRRHTGCWRGAAQTRRLPRGRPACPGSAPAPPARSARCRCVRGRWGGDRIAACRRAAARAPQQRASVHVGVCNRAPLPPLCAVEAHRSASAAWPSSRCMSASATTASM